MFVISTKLSTLLLDSVDQILLKDVITSSAKIEFTTLTRQYNEHEQVDRYTEINYACFEPLTKVVH